MGEGSGRGAHYPLPRRRRRERDGVRKTVPVDLKTDGARATLRLWSRQGKCRKRRMWNFYVQHVGGRWEVRATQDGPAFSYESEQVALEIARASASRRWHEKGIPCGVKVLDEHGHWVFESFNGPPPELGDTR
jgi:hypothetical protein